MSFEVFFVGVFRVEARVAVTTVEHRRAIVNLIGVKVQILSKFVYKAVYKHEKLKWAAIHRNLDSTKLFTKFEHVDISTGSYPC